MIRWTTTPTTTSLTYACGDVCGPAFSAALAAEAVIRLLPTAPFRYVVVVDDDDGGGATQRQFMVSASDGPCN